MASNSLCDPCQIDGVTVIAHKWCAECEESLCKDCDNAHKKNKASRHHHIVDVAVASTFPRVSDDYCSTHSGRKLDLFCIDHDSLCCNNCLTEGHRSCQKILPLDVVAQDVKTSGLYSTVLQDLINIIQDCDNIGKICSKETERNEEEERTILSQITTGKANILEQLNQSEKFIRKELESLSLKRAVQNEQINKEAAQKKKVLESYRRDLLNVTEHGSDGHIFLMANRLKKQIQTTEAFLTKEKSNINTFSVWYSHGQPEPDLLGRLSCHERKIQITPTFGRAQHAMVSTDDTKRAVFFRSKLQLDTKQHFITGITVAGDGSVLLCDNENKCILKYNRNGVNIGKCRLDLFPMFISAIESETAVVSLNPEKLSYVGKLPNGFLGFVDTISLSLVKKITCNIIPFGIAIVGESIAVGTCNAIELFNKKGNHQRKIATPDQFTTVQYIINRPTDDVLCYSLRNVKCISLDGELKNTLESPKSDQTARGLCVDRKGFIYVGFWDGYLCRYSPDGELIDILLNDANKIKNIGDICFNNDFTQLYVVTDKGTSVCIFDFK